MSWLEISLVLMSISFIACVIYFFSQDNIRFTKKGIEYNLNVDTEVVTPIRKTKTNIENEEDTLNDKDIQKNKLNT